jgi:hypothetical protein
MPACDPSVQDQQGGSEGAPGAASEGYLLLKCAPTNGLDHARRLWFLDATSRGLPSSTGFRVFGFFKRRNFRKELEKALADGVLTDDEVSYLEAHSDELGIEQEFVNEIMREHFNTRVASIKKKVEQTHRFSPDDEAGIRKIANDMKMQLDLGPEFKATRCLWAWENGYPIRPEPMAAPILLGGNEACYLGTVAKWKQVKTIKERAGSSGFSTSVRIMEGLSYQVSTVKPEYHTREGLVDISDGTLYVTNKRVIFEGAGRTTSIPYGRLVGLQGYTDGIELKKTTGKNDFFMTSALSAEYSIVLIQHFASEAAGHR